MVEYGKQEGKMKNNIENLTEITDKKSSAGWISGGIAFASWILGLITLPFAGMVAPIWLSFILGAGFFASLIGGSIYWATDGIKNIKDSYRDYKADKKQKKIIAAIEKVADLEMQLEDDMAQGFESSEKQKACETLIQNLIRIKEAEKKQLTHVNTEADVTEDATIDDERTI